LMEIMKYVEPEVHGTVVFIDKNERIKITSENAEQINDNWEEVKDEAELIDDDLAFRHIKSAPYQDGYILKKEITTGTIRVARGYYIILLHEQNKISANVLQVLDSLSAATALWLSR